jgi:hypothetical protein
MKTNCITLELNHTDYVIYLPLQENLDRLGVDTFEELKEKWESQKWNYHTSAEVGTEERDIETPEDTVTCDEWDIILFSSEAVLRDLWLRPFDNSPVQHCFASYEAEQGYLGGEYSKDFAYFDCDGCGRTICEQNPSNGWMVQFKLVNECELECNKCAQERLLQDGVDLEKILDEKKMYDTLFMNTSDLEEAGWTVTNIQGALFGSGRSGSSDGASIFTELQRIKDDGNKAFIEMDSMAIGGMGGYVTIWEKQ